MASATPCSLHEKHNFYPDLRGRPMATGGERGRGRRGRGGGRRGAVIPTITWPGSWGPTEYEAPLEDFPLEHEENFAPPNMLRPYDDRRDAWPMCCHGNPCIVQLFDGYTDGGRRFFRCPFGSSYSDHENCQYTKWVDPEHNEYLQEYIHHLLNKIFDLEQKVEALQDKVDEANLAATEEDEREPCLDPDCNCPCHLNRKTPSPPSPGGPFYYEDGIGYEHPIIS